MSDEKLDNEPNPNPETAAYPIRRKCRNSNSSAVQLEIDDSKVWPLYANFCRVTGTPEELIIDFGLNPQPVGVPTHPIPVTQRIITNFYTAKRMLRVGTHDPTS